MKTKHFINFFAVLLIAFSCKNNKSEDSKTEETPAKQNFSVELDFVASKTDDFTLYFTENNTNEFVGAQTSWKGVNGGNVEEKITFDLAEQIIPTNIRIDLGIKAQDSVVVKNVKVDYYGNTYQFKGSDFFNYFIKDAQFLTKTDPVKGTLTILAKDGVYKTPYYYPTQLTLDKLKEITTKK
jgi:bifunctional DNA-binding transcriptional regulator/antitoxin component of YhaV-PrlF toxin-antitoxin module